MQTIGTTFKNIREERNLLLEDLTQKTGISKAVLSRIENGKRLPTREQVNQLCKYYKAEKNEIIVQWLSDKLVYEVQDEDFALEAMQVAEEKIKYGTNGNGQSNNFVLSLNGQKQKRKIDDFVNKVVQGDCLEVMQSIPDKSVNMIDYSQNKYNKIHVDVADALETMLFEKGTFTHIICNYFTIYQFKDKMLLLRNCYHWITFGGKLILHLVDKDSFDTVIPAGKPLNIECPQKYTKERLLETHIEFDHYKYSRKINKEMNMIQETFTDYSTGKRRQNEQNLYMETKEEIKALEACMLLSRQSDQWRSVIYKLYAQAYPL
jgi:transcriptional regulator with XRE-family HTH domain